MTDAKLFAAMAKAYPKIAGAVKDSTNPHFRSKYADLSSVDAAIRPALATEKLFHYQITHECDGGVCVETLVGHESGEQMSFGKLFIPASKNDAQAYGSALSYARRYSLMAAFGVCPEDDDGNAATSSAPKAISDVQWGEITSLIEASNADVQAFCKAYRITSVKDLPAEAFEHAKGRLEKKLKENAENQND